MTIDFREYLRQETDYAMTEAFRYAKAVPADKLEWKPLELGRSVLDIARELAKYPDWAVEVLDGQGMQLEAEHEAELELSGWKTVEECEAVSKLKLAEFYAYLSNYPDAKFKETIDLPFGEGEELRAFTMAEMADFPRWNAAYHQGQIAYIQTLYGDFGNH